MSRVIYILGAGASFGTRNPKGFRMDRYESGLPVMSEFCDCLDTFCASLRPQYTLGGMRSEPSHPCVYKELTWLRNIAKDNKTIDAYAKKLYVKGLHGELDRMKRALTLFFTLIQSKEKRDRRYDGFLEAVVDNRGKMRSDVSVLSWNYDHQLEYAFHEFEISKTSESHQYQFDNISCKGFTCQYIDYDDSNLVKLNGMAWFKPRDDRYLFDDDDNTLDRFESMLKSGDFNAVNFVSYAWEEDKDFLKKVMPLTYDTEYLVIIGYSFPDVNRVVDFPLINGMKSLKSIVIQDLKDECEHIQRRLIELLPYDSDNEISIRLEKNTNSFYVPIVLTI